MMDSSDEARRWSRESQYWIQEAIGADRDDPDNRWSTVFSPAFEDRADAEASVDLLQARLPFRLRWPNPPLFGPSNPEPPGWKDPTRELRRLVHESQIPTDDLAVDELPEAPFVPVHVVYRVVSRQDLMAQRELDAAAPIWRVAEEGIFNFLRVYPSGESLTEHDVADFETITPNPLRPPKKTTLDYRQLMTALRGLDGTRVTLQAGFVLWNVEGTLRFEFAQTRVIPDDVVVLTDELLQSLPLEPPGDDAVMHFYIGNANLSIIPPLFISAHINSDGEYEIETRGASFTLSQID
jgi:hypothetical protein